MESGRGLVIGVTMGDPCGIGPEVVVKALSDPRLRKRGRFVIYGLEASLAGAAGEAGVSPFWKTLRRGSTLGPATMPDDGHSALLIDFEEFAGAGFGAKPAGPTKAGGAASFAFVEDAIAAALLPERDPWRLDAIVTAPISKQAWALAGQGEWAGHTDFLASRLGAKRSAMLFVSPKLRVALVTVHTPLARVPGRLTIERVEDVIALCAQAGGRLCNGKGSPRIAVCGLNPHAGEGGLMGDEESRIIAPAIERCRKAGIDARGPFPGDTVFLAAARGEHDVVVAMYHDQGLIPVKLLGWEHAVNATLGLPIVRTSPDHGTAFDIAGENEADERSMRAALELAVEWAGAAGGA